jgi:hypothetical protein
MSYEDEKRKLQHASEKVFQAISRLPFEHKFSLLAGTLFGLSAAAGMTTEEIVVKFGQLTEHDSPDGRTTEQLIEAFKRGKAS